MKKLVWGVLCVLVSYSLQASPMDDVWAAFERNDRAGARELLEKALKMPEYRVDAAMTLILLNAFESKKGNLDLMKNAFPFMEDASPYLFSVWFDDAVTGGYSKKNKEQLDFLKTILTSPKANGSIRSAGHYVMGMHYLFSNNLKAAKASWKQAGSIKEWQFAGPFDNSSGSGFNKPYEPISNPAPDAKFISKTNYEISWFTPAIFQQDPWISTIYHFVESNCIIYAQTFIESPADQDVVIAFGGSGSLKVWFNDRLIIRQEEPRTTEMDVYKYTITIPKGVNRILVQLGITDEVNYPNFCVRLVDNKFEPVSGLTYSGTYRAYNKAENTVYRDSISHFAETWFGEKLKQEPANIINYLLLAKTYVRSERLTQAIEVLKQAEKLSPKNILIHYELLQCFNKMKNRTEILKQVETIRDMDAENPFIYGFDFQMNLDREMYDEAKTDLDNMKKALGEEDEEYLSNEISLLVAIKSYQEAIAKVDKAYAKFPEEIDFVKYKFSITKNSRTSAEAIAVLDKYLAKNYSGSIARLRLDEYSSMGDKAKVEKLLLEQHTLFPEDLNYISNVVNHYYQTKNYTKALHYADQSIKNAPYYSTSWSNRAYVNEAMGNKDEAIADFTRAITYNPNLFSAREKVRELQGKKTILSYFRRPDAYDVIKDELKINDTLDDNFKYIFNDRNYVFFPEGASVEYSSLAIKMLNQAGVENWKETSVGYNEYRQYLVIEKAEVIKKNGNRIVAEQNGNELVFPSLEPGDAIYVDYRIDNYTGGKLRKEFWDDMVFNRYVPINESNYRILVPEGVDATFLPVNFEKNPNKSKIEEFDCYHWQFFHPEKCKDESFMPSIYEVGLSLYVSTIKSWSTISAWYQDLAMPLAVEDYNVNLAYNDIFEGKDYTEDYEKARAIYDYICDNIRYSSVSFRQSNYVPQKPMVTISTQLGDCKDVSLLYYTLARKAGISTNLVLVATRDDNGENGIQLPSVSFNHCIVRINLREGPIFQELTNNRLPFGHMPNNILNSQALIIPAVAGETVPDTLIRIPDSPRSLNKFVHKTQVRIQDEDMIISTSLIAGGSTAADFRSYFGGLTNERLREEVLQMLRKPFKNNTTLKDYKISETESRDPEFMLVASLRVEDEIVALGEIRAIKAPFFEELFTLDPFPDQERKYPLVYWKYEYADYFESEISIELPAGMKFTEIPENAHIKTSFIDYSLTYEKASDNVLTVTRKAKINKIVIPSADYQDFRNTVRKIVKAEDNSIVFK